MSIYSRSQWTYPPRVWIAPHEIEGDPLLFASKVAHETYLPYVYIDELTDLQRKYDALVERNLVLESTLNDVHEHCLCERYSVHGFDYGERHRRLGRAGAGKRWSTPRDLIKDFRTRQKALQHIEGEK